MSTLNERIKLRRKELRLTQKELADMLSISDKTVSRWESSNQMPDAILMPEIAQCLQMSLNELYGINEDKVADTSDNIANTEKYPKEKLWLSLSYKLSMLLSVFVVLLGCIFNNNSEKPLNTAGMALVIIGLGILTFVELSYNIAYRDSKIYNPLYLKNDINFCGVAILSIIPILYIADIKYDILLVLALAVAYKVALTLQKRKLKEHGVSTNNKTSKLFMLLFIIFTLLFIAVVVFFKYFYYQYFFKGPMTVAIGLQTMANQSSVSSGFGFPYFSYALGLSVIIYLILIVEYIKLLKNSKQLTLN